MKRGAPLYTGRICVLLVVTLSTLHTDGRAGQIGGPDRDSAFIGFYSDSPGGTASWLAFEQLTGHGHLFISSFMAYWDVETASRFAEAVFRFEDAQGTTTHIPFITLEGWGVQGLGPTTENNRPPDRYGYTFPEFNATALEDTVTALVSKAEIYGDGRPVFIRPAHEMNFVGLYEWSKHGNETFRSFWSHMADVVRDKDGEGIIKIVWGPLLLPSGDDYEDWYPEDNSHIDWIGVDIYSLEVSKGFGQPWTAASLLEALRIDFWEALESKGKSLIIAETSCDVQTYKPQFLTELYDSIASNQELHFIKGVIWFDARNEYNNAYTIPADQYKEVLAKWGVWPANSTGYFANALTTTQPSPTPTPPPNGGESGNLLAIFAGGTIAVALVVAFLIIRKRRQLRF